MAVASCDDGHRKIHTGMNMHHIGTLTVADEGLGRPLPQEVKVVARGIHRRAAKRE